MNLWTDFLQNLDVATVLLAGSLTLLLLNLFLLRRYRNRKADSEMVKSLQRDLRALTSAAVGMGERVLKVERHQRQLAERQEHMDIFEPANQPYENAIRMVQQGAKAEDLIKNCGLSTSEAELISIMHRLDKAS